MILFDSKKLISSEAIWKYISLENIKTEHSSSLSPRCSQLKWAYLQEDWSKVKDWWGEPCLHPEYFRSHVRNAEIVATKRKSWRPVDRAFRFLEWFSSVQTKNYLRIWRVFIGKSETLDYEPEVKILTSR